METINWTADGQVIACISNRHDPAEVIDIVYRQAQNDFVTSGIEPFFGQKELLIPAHLVVKDLHLIGAIVSAILEKLSLAREAQTPFSYARRFTVLDQPYELTEAGRYMQLMTRDE